MKSLFHISALTCLIGLFTTTITMAQQEAQRRAIEAAMQDAIAQQVKVVPVETDKNKKESNDTEDTSRSTSRIFLTNGNKLSGKPLQTDADNNLLFESESLRKEANFPISSILSLNLDGWQPKEQADTLARITLHSRFSEGISDTIVGSLNELTADSIKLDTWYGGIVTLKRSMVKSLQIINNSPGSYFGPKSLKEWTLSGGKGSWSFVSGALVSRAKGGIGRDMELSENSHISFDIEWEKSMSFRLLLYSSDVTNDYPGAFYDLNFNRYRTYLRTHGKLAKRAQRFGVGRGQQIPMIKDGNRAHFDVYANRKAGTFSIYIDGVRACVLQSNNPDPEDLGTGLTFIAAEKYPVKISGLIVIPWNGVSLPNQSSNIEPLPPEDKEASEATEEPKENMEEKSTTPPHKIILNNGDEVPGTVVYKVQDGRIVIETKYTPIKIPIERVKSVSLGDIGEEPRKYPGDVRAWFHQGGFITLKLTSLRDGKITGFSQACGNVTLNLTAFNRIDFHIYDKEANALRKNLK